MSQGLPGDPGLPPGTTNQMISEQFGDPQYDINENGVTTLEEVVDRGQFFNVDVVYDVKGFRDDPNSWDVTFNIVKVVDSQGRDVTQWSKENGVPYDDIIKKYIIEMIRHQ